MAKPTLIRILAAADDSPCPIAGEYIRQYDPDAFNGRGRISTTPDPAQAKPFPDATAALKYWQQQSTAQPYRQDGKPNRPLTAFSVDIGPAPE